MNNSSFEIWLMTSNASLSKKQKPSLTQTPSLQLEIRSLCQVQCFFHQGKAKAFAGNDGHVLRVAANLGRVQTVDARAARKHGFSETGWHKTHDTAYVPQGAFFCLFCFLTIETVEVIAALQLDILVNFDEAEPSHQNFETSRTGLVKSKEISATRLYLFGIIASAIIMWAPEAKELPDQSIAWRILLVWSLCVCISDPWNILRHQFLLRSAGDLWSYSSWGGVLREWWINLTQLELSLLRSLQKTRLSVDVDLTAELTDSYSSQKTWFYQQKRMAGFMLAVFLEHVQLWLWRFKKIIAAAQCEPWKVCVEVTKPGEIPVVSS